MDALQALTPPEAPPALTAREADSIARILDGADRIFLRDGLAGASVDDIARAAGVSKATLYRHFADKTALFMGWLLRRARDAASGVFDDPGPQDPRPLDAVLQDAARRFLRLVADDCGRALFRTAVAEAARLPEVGVVFHNAIVSVGRGHVASVLRRAAARGEIVLDDPDRAACQFMALCRAENMLECVLLTDFRLGDADIERQSRAAVDFFLKGLQYRPA